MDTPIPPPAPPEDADLPPLPKRRVREVIGIGGVIMLVFCSCCAAFCATCTATTFTGFAVSRGTTDSPLAVGIIIGVSAALFLGCYMTSRLLGPAKSTPGNAVTDLQSELSTEPNPGTLESPAKPLPKETEAGP